MESITRILIVDENPLRAAVIEEGLREAGGVETIRIDTTLGLLARITRSIPISSSWIWRTRAATTLEQMFQVSRLVKRRSPCSSISRTVSRSAQRSMQASPPISSTD